MSRPFVALLQQLEACPCAEHLQQCVAAVQAATTAKARTAALKAAAARLCRELQQAGGAAAFDHVLRLCSTAFASSRAAAGGASEEHVLLLYSFVKRLVSLGCWAPALEHGWQLLADVDAAAAHARGPSSTLQEAQVGASLNVILCSCEPSLPVRHTLGRLVDTAGQLVGVLRSLPTGGVAAEHAGVLARCLLKIVLRLGAEAPAPPQHGASSSSSSRDQGMAAAHDWQDATRLLVLHLLAAVQLSGRPQLSEQVALKACQGLPQHLQPCCLVALLQAAGLVACDVRLGGSWDAAALGDTHPRHAPVGVPAVPCLQRLAQLLQEDAASAAACVRTLLQLQQRGQLPPSLCPLLYWLHVSSGHPSPADEAAVAAAVQCSANRQQPLTAASSCGDSDAAAYSRHNSSGGDGMVTLHVVVWSLEQLLQCETGGGELLTGCATAALRAMAAASTDAGQQQTQHAVSSRADALQLATQAVAAAAGCLVHASSSSAAAASGASPSGAEVAAGSLQLLLGELSSAVQALTDWHGLIAHVQQQGPWQCPARAQQLAWLTQRLHAAARSSHGEGKDGAVGSMLAAGLLLSALQCACAAAVQQQGQVQAAAAATKLVAAYFECLWRPRQATPRGAQHHHGAQEAMQVACYLRLQLPSGSWQQLAARWQTMLSSYSQLRCAALATVADAAAGACSSSSQASSGGSCGSRTAKPAQGRSRRGNVRQQASAAAPHSQVRDEQRAALASAYELATVCSTAAESSCSAAACGAHLFWWEGACLLALCSSEGVSCPAEAPTGTIAAANQLLQHLLALPQPADSMAHACHMLARAMLLLQGREWPGGECGASSSSNISSMGAVAVLAAACQQFEALLQLPAVAAAPSVSLGAASSRRNRVTGSSSSRSAGSGSGARSGRAAREQQALDAAISRWGADGAVELLASAALAHCWLAVSRAGLPAGAPWHGAAAAAPCLHDQQPPGGSPARRAAAGATELATSCLLFELCEAAAAGAPAAPAAAAGSAADQRQRSEHLGVWFAEEAGVAAAAAWHVAALQDWNCLQRRLDNVLALLAPAVSPHLHQQLQQLAGLHAASSCSWLASLVAQPQLLLLPACSDDESASAPEAAAGAQDNREPGSDDAGERPTPAQAACAGGFHLACLCTLKQHAEALNTACLPRAGSQQPGGGSGSWGQLLAVQAELAAARAAACCGQAAAAAALAEAAIQQARDVMQGLQGLTAAGGSSSSRQQLQPAGGAGVLHYWPAVALYMSGLLLLSELLESAGCPEDALRLLKELIKLSNSTHCCHMAALAHAASSAIYSRMAGADKAAAAGAAAASCVAYLQQRQAGGCDLLGAYVVATVHQADAAQQWAAQEHATAQQLLQRGMAVLGPALQQQQQQPQQQDTMLWRAVELQARLRLRLSHCCLQLPARSAASAASQQLHEALLLVQGATGSQACPRCHTTAWPVTEAMVSLQLLALSAPRPLTSSGAGKLGLAGFGSSSHSSDLLAEFIDAAEGQDSSCLRDAGEPSHDQATSRQQGRRAAQRAQQGGREAAAKATAGSMDRRRGAAGAVATDAAPAAQSPAAWLCAVLRLLPRLSQHPLVLREACRMVSKACQVQGAVHAAATFLHMSLGTSVGQQQLLLLTSKAAAQQQAPTRAREADGAAWEQLQRHLDLTAILDEASTAAQEALGATGDGAEALWAALDLVSCSWLQRALAALPGRTAACSITLDAPAAVGHQRNAAVIINAAAPLLAGAGCNPAGQLTICRLSQGTCGTGLSLPLLMILPLGAARTQQDAGACSAMLLQELQAIQSDAARSMAASSSISSSAGRTAWWAQRVQLDQRMAALLQQLDKQWLGAWRCLLLPPAEPEVAAAAAAAAADYVAEFFSGVLDEAPKQLLCQLCGLLLMHLQASTTPEVQHALLGLTQLAGQRGDGQVITRLMAGLAAAQAAVFAAAASSGEAGVQQLQASGGVQRADDLPAAPGSSSSSSLVAGAATAQARSVAATPAAKPRRVRFTAVSAVGDADACDDDASSSVRPSSARPARCVQSKRPVAAAPEVAVPPSIARHAARRSRLQAMSSSTPAAARAEGSRPSCGMSAEAPARQAARLGVRHVLQQAGGPVHACDQPAAAGACGRQAGAVLLVLDGSCQQLPWESCPGLLHQHLCRCPSLAVAAATALRSRAGAIAAGMHAGLLRLGSSFYVLNPDGDLAATQATFEAALQQMQLKGFAGCSPSPQQLAAALQQHDLFLYFGHGGGEQYVPLAALKRLERCAGALLMGCSSGRLREAGLYEATGPIWGYMLAGCPAAVANLWDVTDRDIDRFADSVLQSWRSSSHADGGIAMAASVAAARQACRLPHLIGAAAVCYGLPAVVAQGGVTHARADDA